MTLTQGAVMDMRCREGYRLIRTTSPSRHLCSVRSYGMSSWAHLQGMTLTRGAVVDMRREGCRVNRTTLPSRHLCRVRSCGMSSWAHLHGMTLTRCAMIDMRCSEGCRLNSTTSPSRKWRSTTSPTCTVRVIAICVLLEHLQEVCCY